MEKFTPLAKIYTAAGTDGMDKFHLCIIHNLVQFEEDFNSRTKKWVVRLSQTRPIPRSLDGDKNCNVGWGRLPY